MFDDVRRERSETMKYANGECPICGGEMLGDGFTLVLHCENVEDLDCIEPDAQPVYCEIEKQFENE